MLEVGHAAGGHVGRKREQRLRLWPHRHPAYRIQIGRGCQPTATLLYPPPVYSLVSPTSQLTRPHTPVSCLVDTMRVLALVAAAAVLAAAQEDPNRPVVIRLDPHPQRPKFLDQVRSGAKLP